MVEQLIEIGKSSACVQEKHTILELVPTGTTNIANLQLRVLFDGRCSQARR